MVAGKVTVEAFNVFILHVPFKKLQPLFTLFCKPFALWFLYKLGRVVCSITGNVVCSGCGKVDTLIPGISKQGRQGRCHKKAEPKQEMQDATGQKLQTLMKEEPVKIRLNCVSQP